MVEPALPPDLVPIAARLAFEGVPVRAIARSLSQGADIVRDALDIAKADGTISEVPRDDWPPTARRADHLPSEVARSSEGSMLSACMKAFRLTRLQANFMLVLLKRDEADKDMLHFVIEQQRAIRRNRPDDPEPTDPKMVDVVIWNIRKRLKPTGITITTLWGHGYYISVADRAKANALMIEAVQVVNDLATAK